MRAQNLHRRRPRQTQERRMRSILSAGATDVGRCREGNEDCFAVLPDHGLLLVADGMGGHEQGEVASAMAINEISTRYMACWPFMSEAAGVRALHEAIAQASEAIYQAGQTVSKRSMGTTVVAALVYDRRLFLACVGDSRAYLKRGDNLLQVTRDQTMATALVDRGHYPTDAQAYKTMHAGYAHALSQFVGCQYPLDVALTTVNLRRGDVLLLCSDGLTGMLTDKEIQEALSAEADPAKACAKLIELANAAGGEDNITAIVARFEGDALPPPTPQDVADLKREPYVLAPTAG